jgi:hypothetical protein
LRWFGVPVPIECDSARSLADNKESLRRYTNCQNARTKVQAAFKSGLDDVEACRKNKPQQCGGGSASTELLKTIETVIKDRQKVHADQIAAQDRPIGNCKAVITSQQAQAYK